MPKNNQIKKILVIGSGPIVIGQACEFDYSGTQAIRALREEGYQVVLVNSNPATIMTDPELADATYIEPITLDYVTEIIVREKPDALIATLGGQTSLNCALSLHDSGILAKYHVQLLGASVDAIRLAEDRALFHNTMKNIGIDVPKSQEVHSLQEALEVEQAFGLPLIIRSSFSLGGKGAAIVHTSKEAYAIFKQAFSDASGVSLTIDEALIGWKEFELEVVRDKEDNCIVVCGVENVDPLGIHTGDSMTVAPIQTLTDKEYQHMREVAFSVLRAVGVETGGSNVQFAVHPKTGRMVVIEMNPRVSRSSALVSKATGFPIAKIAAKLAVGYSLNELRNDITCGVLPASFEPSIDYVVVKIPRFHDEKWDIQTMPRGPKMRSIGEVMAIGSTFAESLNHAVSSLEQQGIHEALFKHLDDETLHQKLRAHDSLHFFYVLESLSRDYTVEDVHQLTHIDPWFLDQIQRMVNCEYQIQGHDLQSLDKTTLLMLKKQGVPDKRIAALTLCDEKDVRQYRQALSVCPVYKCVDSCAGEFQATTSYLYSTYQPNCEARVSLNKKVLIVGSGPNRIGQGIEFDYVCVKAIQAFSKAGYETIMLNCNPETVSTDHDVATSLYFIPLTHEKILDVIEKEKPTVVALQFGGQTPLNLVRSLQSSGVPMIGLDETIVAMTEDRDQFRQFLQQLGLKQPKNKAIYAQDDLEHVMSDLAFPLIIRPSYILGGSGMEIVHDTLSLQEKMHALFASQSHGILVEEFLQDAIEIDVDAICDGEDVFIPTILEHIEAAGVHSGDSACITPPYRLSQAMIRLIHHQTKIIACALTLKGLINIQFAVRGKDVFVIEVNPRASRTTPFIAKATGLPVIDIAVKCLLGETLREQRCLSPVRLPYYCVKEAVLPFYHFASFSPVLSPEMRATGEVMGIGRTKEEAFLKAQRAAGYHLPFQQKGVIFLAGVSPDDELVRALIQANFKPVFHLDDEKPLLMIILNADEHYLLDALQRHIPYVTTKEAAMMMVNSLIVDTVSPLHVQSLQHHYLHIKHPNGIRHVLTGNELSATDITSLLARALHLKKNPVEYARHLAMRSLAMLFTKPSFHTRLSFTKAMHSLGGHVIESVSTTRKSEEPMDTIRVLNGYCDGVMVRTHDDMILHQMACFATIPIINGLTARYHPCQVLADLMTLQETFGVLSDLTVAYIGDGNNVLHSLLMMAPKVGVRVHYCCPFSRQPQEDIVKEALLAYPDRIVCFENAPDAVLAADAVYTDVWSSMGFEDEHDDDLFNGMQVDEQLMQNAQPNAIFMHCMPMERGKEVSMTLPDNAQSVIFEQSENRLHVQKALLLHLIKQP
jgi:carbamoyl-phosphate synthase large subunit